jgi:hypothetical protein
LSLKFLDPLQTQRTGNRLADTFSLHIPIPPNARSYRAIRNPAASIPPSRTGAKCFLSMISASGVRSLMSAYGIECPKPAR